MILTVMLAITASLSGVYAILNWIWGAELRETMAVLRNQGNALTMKALNDSNLDPSSNAAQSFDSLFCRMTSEHGGNIYVPGIDPGVLDERLRILLEHLPTSKPERWTLDLEPIKEIIKSDFVDGIVTATTEAVKQNHLFYNFDYETRPLSAVPHSILFEKLIKILCAKAIVQANDDDLEAAFETLENGFQIVRLLGDDPPLITQLVRCETALMLTRTIEFIVGRNGVTDVQALKILNVAQTLRLGDGVKRGVHAERIMFGKNVFEPLIRGTDLVARGNPNGVISNNPFINRLLLPLRKKDYTIYLALMSDVAALFDDPYWRVAKDGKMNELNEKIAGMGPYCPITRKIIPDLSSLRKKVAEVKAEFARCVITLALNVYRNNENDNPTTLQELEPVILKRVPVNPITGKPFQYDQENGVISISE